MSVVAEKSADATAIRRFHVDTPGEALDDLRRRIAATQWPEKETVPDDSQGVPLATMQKLARYWATEYDWRKCEARAERLPAVHHGDRRPRHPLHPRPLAARRTRCRSSSATAGPGSIIEQMKLIEPLTDPTAHGGKRGRRVRRRDPVHAGLRLLRQAHEHGLGPGAHGARLGGADEAARLQPLRRPGRRLGRLRRRSDGRCRHLRDCSPSTPTCRPRFPPTSTRRCSPASPPPAGLSAEERRAYEQLLRTSRQVELRADHGRPAADPVRHRGLAGRPRRLAARPQRRRRPAGRRGGVRARADRERDGRADARRDPRQHHALLADEHGRLRVPPLLGVQGRLLQRQGRQRSRWR